MKKEPKKIGILLILSWIFSILFMISSFVWITTNVFGAILIFLGGLAIFPPFDKLIVEKANIKFTGWLKFFVFIALVLIGSSIINPLSSSERELFPDKTSDTITTPKTEPTSPKQEESKLDIIQLDCSYDGYSDILGHQAKYLGRVKNKGNSLQEFVKVDIDFFDESGKLVGTDFTYVSGTDIPAGETRSFQGTAFDLTSDFETCEARVSE